MADVNGDVVVDLPLPALPSSAGEARRAVRRAVEHTLVDNLGALEELVDDLLVAVSELVTNAVLHAGSEIRLRVRTLPSWVRIEVFDGSPHLPRTIGAEGVAATGRGLRLVAELVDRWGAEAEGGGKVVWCEVSRDHVQEGAGVVLGAGPGTDTVGVVLRNVPLLMHAAWQEAAAALLRELMLMDQVEDPESAVEAHSLASGVLSTCAEQIPEPDLGEDPSAIMLGAVDPLVSLEQMVLEVPRDAVADFERLGRMLERATTFADYGEFLAVPTQPEIRAMRQWLCGEVARQVAGVPPTPWSPPSPREVTPGPPIDGWDPDEVNSSPLALLAADDANRILAVSDSALAALGYGRSELVGQRLLALIPPRYQQAHVAGFTRHVVNGRSPLLGQLVTVPVVAAGGAEVEAKVQIDRIGLVDGRSLFYAQFSF
jgi:PAS domain S-box-containing protein